ncbi:hypothetical protein [Pseudomonas versuta]|jgi:hypothetical protein|uniref:Lipoprotein n=1 Tax=Pseudomonas versuta TaxID=1788301 RepID=A0A0M3UER9_9PSED|nr:hypothetical protein [Pseudomonas versuta]ALE90055.1 hypothetical protein AOC04_18540 [Pseudomonas versuta]OKA20997.1 hypothetical protein BOH73_11560 [Pseudomonas versuta]OKA25567.1 hypothetical protein BOH74_08010 [Pseudomonas versuta]
MSYLLRVTLIALALLTTVSCSSKRMLTPDRTLHPSIHADRAQMQQAIVKSLVGRGWTVQKITPERVQAQITVREQFHAEIDIPYSATHYQIIYRNSSGLDYKDGKIHKNYIRWVRLLDRDIVRDLKDNQNERTAQQLSEAAAK